MIGRGGEGFTRRSHLAAIQAAGQTSLFDVVSKRYSSWNTDIKSRKNRKR